METDPRAILAALATERGDSLAALSSMIGRNPAYLQQYVRRGTPRVLAERDRRMLADYLGIAESLLGAPVARGGFRLPRLDVVASAGPGALIDGEIALGTDTLDAALARRLGLRSGSAAIIRVRGASMEPGLLDGDMIVVDTADRSFSPGIHVIRIDGVTMVKRLARIDGRLVATSDNPDAAPIPDAAIAIIGRVVWLMRAPR